MDFCQKKLSFYIFSPGCRTNQCDGEMLSYILKKNDFKRVKDIENANFIIISGCVVTEKAEKEAMRFIRKAKKINPEAKIVLTGCLAERQINAPISSIFYDLIIPNREREFIFKILKGERVDNFSLKEKIFFSPVPRIKNKTRFFFKIQEGCFENCAYCYVRVVRGKPWSLPKEEVLKHIRKVIKNNVREIILCGTHLGIYGKDIGYSLKELIKEIEAIDENFRFRLSSLEPWDLNDELLEVLINSKKFCNFFHLPLQSGSDFVLKEMRRNFKTEKYFNLIIKLKKDFSNPRIGADVIVGFPSEKEKDFLKTYDFLKKTPIDYLHIFTYSPRPNNPVLPAETSLVLKKRYRVLKELDREKRENDKKVREGTESQALSLGKEGILKENYYCIFEKKFKRSLLLSCKIVKWNNEKAIVKILE